MTENPLIKSYSASDTAHQLYEHLHSDPTAKIHLKGSCGSSPTLYVASLLRKGVKLQLVIMNDKEEAAYFYNDLENLFDERHLEYFKRKVLFFPATYRRPYEIEKVDNNNVLRRTEVLKRLGSQERQSIIITYAEALSEKVVTRKYLKSNTLRINKDEGIGLDFVADLLLAYNFEATDFVSDPGQFAIRGGIIDLFSFSNDNPYRIEFFGDKVESIRSFDAVTQRSKDTLNHITVIPNLQSRQITEKRQSFLDYMPSHALIWIKELTTIKELLDNTFNLAHKTHQALADTVEHQSPETLFCKGEEALDDIRKRQCITLGSSPVFEETYNISVDQSPQPSFNKNFPLLISSLEEHTTSGHNCFILSDSPKQIDRLYKIFEDIIGDEDKVPVKPILLALHQGFIDHDQKVVCFTDHQIFERYHKFHLRDGYKRKEAITLKEIYNLQQGDFVTHIDHGVGRFDGLETIENNGKKQEAVRLIYKNSDILYVSIHSLHRIARYTGKEGTEPRLDKLGSNAWKNLKERTKKRVKDIARDLIKLYAKRLSTKGFAFTPDTYLQHELEASFIFEDTPDQITATQMVKEDMENPQPMDRLICGDVGFGKTEVAIRAAFKAVADSKQVAVLVPTTILALQHYHTFIERLQEFPCNIDYINRFRSTKQQKIILEKLANGNLDIIIGTHRLIGKDVIFNDLGLLIIDEEQKFGVSVKEKLRQMRVNVDTLTLTATPIPRTLQFSLMGARDMSVINTPPPNRYPIHTELQAFNEEQIRNAIHYELSRGGQVFFLHNRVQNINDIAGLVSRLIPDARVAVGHGQMDGKKLEQVMMDFINGDYDILVATTIIESGLDIPNANTIIINDAHTYGLSDLHQLRGRVGRSNKKAFCFLLTPPLSTLTSEAKKRLHAIEEFSNLGSGFNIAMRDLDIRGAGNILGAEQSGFISEIGYEMYHRILKEAVDELKKEEFSDVFKDTKIEKQQITRECQIETDLELLLPQSYVESTTERLNLYRELDAIDTEVQLTKFIEKIIDRFGALPQQTIDLIDAIRLRWLAGALGFEKVVLRNNRLSCYFPENQNDIYFQSDAFIRVIDFVKQNPKTCLLKEKNNMLRLIFPSVKQISDAISSLMKIKSSE